MKRSPTELTSAQTVSVPDSPAPSVSHLSHSSIADEGRFIPGTFLAGRYRIVGLLGQGGMGEVYRATDLTLGQSVALKFLPAAAAGNRFLLERFHAEVRIARQISHPNVCRVYDIGEVDGQPFISMEYIDGEDLASLLPRIGRLPAERAIEAARKICAGLAAAHARGVIHRDLKPHNIMMNKRGEIVIMDFGLAAIADQLSGPEARNGTPAYMSPEQLKGADVTARSDIYALGLVLYELFTGKRPFDAKTIPLLIQQQESAHLGSMTSVAADIDPAVENVIRRCLDPDPARRPESALSVSAALPGGDPLAAALAAGETPSPELVAAAGKTEGMPIKYAIGCVAVFAACLLTIPFLKQAKVGFLQTAADYPPDVLHQKGRDLSALFGYPGKPADSLLWLDQRLELLTFLNLHPAPRHLVEWLNAESPVRAIYRESSSPMVSQPDGYVSETNPPLTTPGMTEVEMDAEGRLRGFMGVPPRGATPLADAPIAAVFGAAQLDWSRFAEAAPTSVPIVPADTLKAWNGAHPSIPGLNLHVEIGSWRGRITWVNFRWPWTKDTGDTHHNAWISRFQEFFLPLLLGSLILFVVLLARRNWKLGRGDKRGAFTVGLTMFFLSLMDWAARTHVAASSSTFGFFLENVGSSLLNGTLFLLLYMALEPAVRLRWPHSLITWTRALAGRFGDPRLASDILIGASIGALLLVLADLNDALRAGRNGFDTVGGLYMLNGTRFWISGVIGRIHDGITTGLMIFFAIFALRTVLRRDWIAALAGALLFALQAGDLANAIEWQVQFAVYLTVFAALIFTLLRLGLVVTVAAVFTINLVNAVELGSDWNAWYAPYSFATMALALGIAAWAFWKTLGDRDLFSGKAEG